MHFPFGRREFLGLAAIAATRSQACDDAADQAKLESVTTFEGADLKFDFPALRVGVAEYAEGPTGCTVLYFPKGARCAADVRGGSPGTMLAGDGWLDALCYAGGSFYGLEAATGVAAELFEIRNHSTRWGDIATVRTAVIYDFPPRRNAVYPDKALGRAALKAAKAGAIPIGPRGAGRSATVGKALGLDRSESAGQGAAFRQVGPTKILVVSVVNALGAIVDRAGRVVRGQRDPRTGERLSVAQALDRRLTEAKPPPGNTTLTAVVTNQKLEPWSLSQLAKQVHSSMARAIQPFHAPEDGDVLYAVTTGEVDDAALLPMALGVVASELAWDAVLASFSSERR